MSTTLEPQAQHPPGTTASLTAADRIRNNFAACRVKFTWLGTSKTLTPEQKDDAARSFDAEGDSITAGKKLIDTKHDAYRALTSIRSQINSYWKDNSLPYPEPGIRLIRQNRIDDFDSTLQGFREQLQQAVSELNRQYAEIKSAARVRLGSLYNEDDYPASLDDMFGVQWDFPSVDPPDYLRQLNPALYEEQSRRIAHRFDQAVEMAESAFMEELGRLVSHLTERLAGADDGKPKIFRDTAVENLNEFFTRFRDLSVRSNEQLDELVDRCQQVISGVEPQQLRDNGQFRQDVATRLAGVQSTLDGLLVDRPRRNILRRQR